MILLPKITKRICYATWQGGIKVADGIKVANQLTLKEGDFSWII